MMPSTLRMVAFGIVERHRELQKCVSEVRRILKVTFTTSTWGKSMGIRCCRMPCSHRGRWETTTVYGVRWNFPSGNSDLRIPQEKRNLKCSGYLVTRAVWSALWYSVSNLDLERTMIHASRELRFLIFSHVFTVRRTLVAFALCDTKRTMYQCCTLQSNFPLETWGNQIAERDSHREKEENLFASLRLPSLASFFLLFHLLRSTLYFFVAFQRFFRGAFTQRWRETTRRPEETKAAEARVTSYTNETLQRGRNLRNQRNKRRKNCVFSLSPSLSLSSLSFLWRSKENSKRDRIFIHEDTRDQATGWKNLSRPRRKDWKGDVDKKTRLTHDTPVWQWYRFWLCSATLCNLRMREMQIRSSPRPCISTRDPLSSSRLSFSYPASHSHWPARRFPKVVSTDGENFNEERKCLRGSVINFTARRVPSTRTNGLWSRVDKISMILLPIVAYTAAFSLILVVRF